MQNKFYGSLMTVKTLFMVKGTLKLVLYTNGVVFRKFGYCKPSRGKTTGHLEGAV